MRRGLACALACTFVLIQSSNAAETISDSLVSNLSCKGLTETNVLQYYRQEAFSADRELPLENYDWHGGVCMGFAYVQRAIFYLMRPEASAPVPQANDTRKIANMLMGVGSFFGSLLRATQKEEFRSDVFPLQFSVFNVPDQTSFMKNLTTEKHIFWSLEGNQIRRNWGYANMIPTIATNIRPISANRERTFLKIKSEIALGRMPMLGLYPKTTGGHAVLAKKIIHDESHDRDEIVLYDSNYPGVDPHLFYSHGKFQMSEEGTYAGQPLKVDVLENASMNKIQKAAYDFYKSKVRRAVITAQIV